MADDGDDDDDDENEAMVLIGLSIRFVPLASMDPSRDVAPSSRPGLVRKDVSFRHLSKEMVSCQHINEAP